MIFIIRVGVIKGSVVLFKAEKTHQKYMKDATVGQAFLFNKHNQVYKTTC